MQVLPNYSTLLMHFSQDIKIFIEKSFLFSQTNPTQNNQNKFRENEQYFIHFRKSHPNACEICILILFIYVYDIDVENMLGFSVNQIPYNSSSTSMVTAAILSSQILVWLSQHRNTIENYIYDILEILSCDSNTTHSIHSTISIPKLSYAIESQLILTIASYLLFFELNTKTMSYSDTIIQWVTKFANKLVLEKILKILLAIPDIAQSSLIYKKHSKPIHQNKPVKHMNTKLTIFEQESILVLVIRILEQAYSHLQHSYLPNLTDHKRKELMGLCIEISYQWITLGKYSTLHLWLLNTSTISCSLSIHILNALSIQSIESYLETYYRTACDSILSILACIKENLSGNEPILYEQKVYAPFFYQVLEICNHNGVLVINSLNNRTPNHINLIDVERILSIIITWIETVSDILLNIIAIRAEFHELDHCILQTMGILVTTLDNINSILDHEITNVSFDHMRGTYHLYLDCYRQCVEYMLSLCAYTHHDLQSVKIQENRNENENSIDFDSHYSSYVHSIVKHSIYVSYICPVQLISCCFTEESGIADSVESTNVYRNHLREEIREIGIKKPEITSSIAFETYRSILSYLSSTILTENQNDYTIHRCIEYYTTSIALEGYIHICSALSKLIHQHCSIEFRISFVDILCHKAIISSRLLGRLAVVIISDIILGIAIDRQTMDSESSQNTKEESIQPNPIEYLTEDRKKRILTALLTSLLHDEKMNDNTKTQMIPSIESEVLSVVLQRMEIERVEVGSKESIVSMLSHYQHIPYRVKEDHIGAVSIAKCFLILSPSKSTTFSHPIPNTTYYKDMFLYLVNNAKKGNNRMADVYDCISNHFLVDSNQDHFSSWDANVGIGLLQGIVIYSFLPIVLQFTPYHNSYPKNGKNINNNSNNNNDNNNISSVNQHSIDMTIILPTMSVKSFKILVTCLISALASFYSKSNSIPTDDHKKSLLSASSDNIGFLSILKHLLLISFHIQGDYSIFHDIIAVFTTNLLNSMLILDIMNESVDLLFSNMLDLSNYIPSSHSNDISFILKPLGNTGVKYKPFSIEKKQNNEQTRVESFPVPIESYDRLHCCCKNSVKTVLCDILPMLETLLDPIQNKAYSLLFVSIPQHTMEYSRDDGNQENNYNIGLDYVVSLLTECNLYKLWNTFHTILGHKTISSNNNNDKMIKMSQSMEFLRHTISECKLFHRIAILIQNILSSILSNIDFIKTVSAVTMKRMLGSLETLIRSITLYNHNMNIFVSCQASYSTRSNQSVCPMDISIEPLTGVANSFVLFIANFNLNSNSTSNQRLSIGYLNILIEFWIQILQDSDLIDTDKNNNGITVAQNIPFNNYGWKELHDVIGFSYSQIYQHLSVHSIDTHIKNNRIMDHIKRSLESIIDWNRISTLCGLLLGRISSSEVDVDVDEMERRYHYGPVSEVSMSITPNLIDFLMAREGQATLQISFMLFVGLFLNSSSSSSSSSNQAYIVLNHQIDSIQKLFFCLGLSTAIQCLQRTLTEILSLGIISCKEIKANEQSILTVVKEIGSYAAIGDWKTLYKRLLAIAKSTKI